MSMKKVYGHYKQFWTPEYWQGWSEREGDPVQQYRQAREKWLCAELLDVGAGALVLEAGCGYGRISRVVLQKPLRALVAVDLSAEMVAPCRAQLPPIYKGSVANIEELPFADQAFDAVLFSRVLMHLDDDAPALPELVR